MALDIIHKQNSSLCVFGVKVPGGELISGNKNQILLCMQVATGYRNKTAHRSPRNARCISRLLGE